MKLDNKGYIQRTFKDKLKKVRLEIIPLVVFAVVSPDNDKVSLGSDKVSLQNDTRVSLGSEQNKNTTNKKSKEELPDWLNKEIWLNWISYRKEQRKPLTSQSIRLQLKELGKDIPHHAEILEQSIKNGWTGLFPLKGDVNKNNILKAKNNKYDRFN